jgi:hypothetical protein
MGHFWILVFPNPFLKLNRYFNFRQGFGGLKGPKMSRFERLGKDVLVEEVMCYLEPDTFLTLLVLSREMNRVASMFVLYRKIQGSPALQKRDPIIGFYNRSRVVADSGNMHWTMYYFIRTKSNSDRETLFIHSCASGNVWLVTNIEATWSNHNSLTYGFAKAIKHKREGVLLYMVTNLDLSSICTKYASDAGRLDLAEAIMKKQRAYSFQLYHAEHQPGGYHNMIDDRNIQFPPGTFDWNDTI